MQHKFKVGDIVRTLHDRDIYDIEVHPAGSIGTIVAIDTDEEEDQAYSVKVNETTFWYAETELELSTNKHYLLSLSNEALAELLVNTIYEEEGYYGYDGEDEYYIEQWNPYYTTPASTEYYCYEDAINDIIEWLDKPYNGSLNNLE